MSTPLDDRHTPPGPRSRVPGRTALAFGRDRIGFLARLARQYGDVVLFRIGGTSIALLNHPTFVRDVLVTRQRMFRKGIGLERAKVLLGNGLLTSEGGEHLRQRRLMQPAFHRERIAAYAHTMVAYAARHTSRWTASQEVDVSKEMAALTLAIAGKTLFNADVEEEATDIGGALASAIDAFGLALLPAGDKLIYLPIPSAIKFRRARRRLDATVYRLIAERRARGVNEGDLLSMLVFARDTDGDGTGMSDLQLRDEALTILLAGHETTANALTWAWYLLSENRAADERLMEELRAVLGDRDPTADDLPHLPFTRAVVAETMRLYPPAYLVGRRALAPYEVPDTSYVLPAGTVVFLSQYLLHRDPRFWPDAERFLPERWLSPLNGPGHEPSKYAYFPFGAGTRMCIGEHFAWMEATLVLATIARRWRLTLVAGHPVVPEPIITLRAKHGMRMYGETRAR